MGAEGGEKKTTKMKEEDEEAQGLEKNVHTFITKKLIEY
jgi:hypothetical protein